MGAAASHIGTLFQNFIADHILDQYKMEEYQSETDSDYTSYWRDWVRLCLHQPQLRLRIRVLTLLPDD
jgi:hypothetical protein